MPRRKKRKKKSKPQLDVGSAVFHERFGEGRIQNRWGVFEDLDLQLSRHGVPVTHCDGTDIFEVRFGEEHFCRPVNKCWLEPAESHNGHNANVRSPRVRNSGRFQQSAPEAS